MKKQTKNFMFIFLLIFAGCGMLSRSLVPKEQLNGDLADKTIKVRHTKKGEVDWDFKKDNFRCFAPSGEKDAVTENTADISLNVSSIVTSNGSGPAPVMFGKLLLHYKKDGDKWKLQSIEPKDALSNEIDGDKFDTYINKQMPLCNYFKYEDFNKKSVQNPPAQPTEAPAPSDNARRINAEELHTLWEKNEVLIVDTRSDSVYHQEHIKGAILIPSNKVIAKVDELPRNKMVVTY